MKKIIAIIYLVLSTVSLYAKEAQDSLLLKIDKRNQTLIGGKDSKRTLKEELESAFEKKGIVLTDSLWQNIRQAIKTDSDGDSTISVRIGNSSVKIAISKSPLRGSVDSGQSTVASSQRAIDSRQSGKKEEVRVGMDGIHVKDGNEETHVTWDGVYHKDGKEVTKVVWGKDSTKLAKKDAALFKDNGLHLNLGLNGMNGNPGQLQTTVSPPALLSTDFDLKTINSTFVSLAIDESMNLVSGTKSAWRLGYGVSVDWYNFQFDHSRVIQKSASGQTIFQPIISKGAEIELEKNKLAVSYVTLPLMSQFVFRKVSAIQMISFGGYASYRLTSWSKTKEDKSGDRNKESSNFNLNQFRYGLRAEFAFRRFPDLFFNYDLNPLFESSTGLKMNGFSFGVKLL
jgi:hypothetical protein